LKDVLWHQEIGFKDGLHRFPEPLE
jgi:hypothetical protein